MISTQNNASHKLLTCINTAWKLEKPKPLVMIPPNALRPPLGILQHMYMS